MILRTMSYSQRKPYLFNDDFLDDLCKLFDITIYRNTNPDEQPFAYAISGYHRNSGYSYAKAALMAALTEYATASE